jgi:hypothetical protein
MLRRTNEAAVSAGIYHSMCKCRTEYRVRVGDRFPHCPKCHEDILWAFTRSIHAADPQPRKPSDSAS